MRWNIFEKFGKGEKFYLTQQGLEDLKKEYQALKELKKSKIRDESPPKVLHSDDLDPEYLSFKEDMELLESGIKRYRHVLNNVKLIEAPSEEERDKVHLGAKVKVEVEGQEDQFLLVGTFEANPDLGKISNKCLVGKALLGHQVGDQVVVQSAIETTYKIKDIKYDHL